MRRRARSNTALFGFCRWLPSAHTNPPRRGAPDAMDSSCAAGLPADAKYCVTGVPAAVAASRYSRCGRAHEALRLGECASLAAQGRLRAAVTAGNAAARRRLHVFLRKAGGRMAEARHPGLAQAQRGRFGTKLPQALHSRGIPSRAGQIRPGGRAGAASGAGRRVTGDALSAEKASEQAGKMMKSALRFAVRSYQVMLSPLLPRACRFHPSCSEYAREALDRHGACRGSWLAARRVARCGPWHPGGYDPVP
jgi:uncharacterized protein